MYDFRMYEVRLMYEGVYVRFTSSDFSEYIRALEDAAK